MKSFEVGKVYEMRSPCDHECIWRYQVTARSDISIMVTDEQKKSRRLRINQEVSQYRNAETVYPLGKYSLCPSLSADKETSLKSL